MVMAALDRQGRSLSTASR